MNAENFHVTNDVTDAERRTTLNNEILNSDMDQDRVDLLHKQLGEAGTTAAALLEAGEEQKLLAEPEQHDLLSELTVDKNEATGVVENAASYSNVSIEEIHAINEAAMRGDWSEEKRQSALADAARR